LAPLLRCNCLKELAGASQALFFSGNATKGGQNACGLYDVGS